MDNSRRGQGLGTKIYQELERQLTAPAPDKFLSLSPAHGGCYPHKILEFETACHYSKRFRITENHAAKALFLISQQP